MQPEGSMTVMRTVVTTRIQVASGEVCTVTSALFTFLLVSSHDNIEDESAGMVAERGQVRIRQLVHSRFIKSVKCSLRRGDRMGAGWDTWARRIRFL